MGERKTKFRWFKRKGSRKLTVKAKKWLSEKLKEYWEDKKEREEEERIGVPPELLFFRYSAFKLWTVEDDEDYFPQLEIKAHIFSREELDKLSTKIGLNEMIKITKEDYDFNEFFHFEVTRRRIAYEAEAISEEEFKETDITILTVNEDIDTIRKGFPKTRSFKRNQD